MSPITCQVAKVPMAAPSIAIRSSAMAPANRMYGVAASFASVNTSRCRALTLVTAMNLTTACGTDDAIRPPYSTAQGAMPLGKRSAIALLTGAFACGSLPGTALAAAAADAPSAASSSGPLLAPPPAADPYAVAAYNDARGLFSIKRPAGWKQVRPGMLRCTDLI